MGVGQPGLVLEPSGQWEAANGLSAGGYGLPETLLRVGKRHRFHPRAQGQSWRGKTVGGQSSAQLQADTDELSHALGGQTSWFLCASPPAQQPAQDTLQAELEAVIQLQALGSSGG